MPERSCPSCHEPVAAHQTLCPVCRTPVPSEAGPVATESSAFTFAAPPPRQARPSGAPEPAATDPADEPGYVVGSSPVPTDAPPPGAAVGADPAAPLGWDTEAPPAFGADPAAPLSSAAEATAAFGADPAAPTTWEAEPAPAPVAPAWEPPAAEPAADGPFVVGPSTASRTAPEPTAPTGDATSAFGGPGAPAWSPAEDATAIAPVAPAVPAPVTWATDPAAGAPASAGTLGTPGAAALDERGNLPGGVVGLVAAALVTIGVFLPWIGVEGRDVSGWAASGDAKVLLGIAGVATVVAALLIGGARSLVLRLALVVLGVAALGLGAFEITSAGGIEDFDVSVGAGLFVVLAGGAALAAAGIVTRHKRFR